MKKLLSIIFVLFIAVSLIGGLLVGCKGTTTTKTSTTTALKEAVITIGTDGPLTGGAAPWGLSVQHGVTLACDDVNAAGGLTIGDTHYTFKAECLDDKYDTAAATNNLRQMVFTDGIKYVFTFQTEGTMAVTPILTQNKVINFTVVNTNTIISQPTNSYTFRTFMPTSIQLGPIIQYLMQQHPNIKTVTNIVTNDQNGQFAIDLTKQVATANGLTALAAISYDPGTPDFLPFVTKLIAEKPDLIVATEAPTGDVALIIKGLNGMGYKGVILAGTVGAADLLPIAGEAALEGVYTSNLPMKAPTVTDAVLGLPAREVAKWGTAYCCTWDFYSQAMVMIEAMKRAKSVDSTAVRNILQDGTQKWPYAAINGGVCTFNSAPAQALYGADATNQILNPYAICIIHNGQDTVATVIQPPGS